MKVNLLALVPLYLSRHSETPLPDRDDRLSASAGAARFWPSVAALSLITLLIQGCTIMALAVYLSPVARDLAPIGNPATIFLLAMSLSSLPAGWALQRVRPRLVIGTGVALTATGWLAAAGAQDRLILTLALGVAGWGVGAATIVPGIAILTRHYPHRRGLALAIFLGAAIAAGAVMPPVVSWAIANWGWRAAFQLSGLAIAAICVPLLALVPGQAIADRARRPSRGRITAKAIGNPNFLCLLIAMTLIQLAINGVLFGAIDNLMLGGLSQSAAVAAYSIANLLGLPALLIGGMLTDRTGPRPMLIGTALLLGAGTATLLAAQPSSLIGVAAFVILWGIASALPGQSGSMLLADAVEPQDFAALLGINTSAIGLAGALAPAWTQWLRMWSGDPALPIWIYAALAWCAIPLIAGVRPRGSEG